MLLSQQFKCGEYDSLAMAVEDYHVLFYKMWEMGRPVFTRDTDTACVTFNDAGEFLEFRFNPDFWDELDQYNRLFVICHECLHVILNHGVRTQGHIDDKINVALDLVVNHMLVEGFDFERKRIVKGACWVNTVWGKRTKMGTTHNAEHYYLNLPTRKIARNFDDHTFLSQEQRTKVFEKISKRLNNDERDMIKQSFDGTGGGAGNSDKAFDKLIIEPPVPINRKFEKLVKKWSRRYMPSHDDCDQWSRLHRRLHALNSEFLLPSEMETEKDVPQACLEILSHIGIITEEGFSGSPI